MRAGRVLRLCAVAGVLLVAACTRELESAPSTPAAAPAQRPDAGAAAPSRKRSAPPKVAPVEHRGVRYAVVRGAKGRGLPQNGGYVEATDIASGRSLWLVKVYEVVYDPGIEDDKREVYIRSLRLDAARGRLLVDNERGERFAVVLDGSQVQKLSR
jgi:hypothetical protein